MGAVVPVHINHNTTKQTLFAPFSTDHKLIKFNSEPSLNVCPSYSIISEDFLCKSKFNNLVENNALTEDLSDCVESNENARAPNRGSDPLFMCYVNNVYPEKRQSDPHIHNKSFDVAAQHRFLSQNDVRSRPIMPNIDEYCFEDAMNWPNLMRPSYEMDDDTITPSTKSLSSVTSLPKIKVRVSDEWGRRINSIESPASDLFDDMLDDVGREMDMAVDRSDSSMQQCHRRDAFAVADVGDAGTQCCDKIERCKKCGHRALKWQFSTSFN